MIENHKHTCDVCNITLKTKEKMQNHICRIQIQNPEHKNLYLKNWIVSKSCLTVFCKQKRKEEFILHSEDCLDFINSCQDLHGWYCRGDEPLGDQHGTGHLRLNDCIQNGVVTWTKVKFCTDKQTHLQLISSHKLPVQYIGVCYF